MLDTLLQNIINRDFFNESPKIVAPKLLGKYIVRRIDEHYLVGKIVEVEAYLAFGDAAAHNAVGKTKRSISLFNDAGYTYVHTMRQYCLIDIVTESSDKPGSVLIRAIEPIIGIDKMLENRKVQVVENIGNGPGKVCMAMQIKKEHNGIDITDVNSQIFICNIDAELDVDQVLNRNRVGISKATELLLGFYIKNNSFVSKLSK